MHNGMPYDPIQGQGQGHGASKSPDFLYLSYFLCHVTLNLEGSQPFVRPEKKFFSDFNEIWYVDRVR